MLDDVRDAAAISTGRKDEVMVWKVGACFSLPLLLLLLLLFAFAWLDLYGEEDDLVRDLYERSPEADLLLCDPLSTRCEASDSDPFV